MNLIITAKKCGSVQEEDKEDLVARHSCDSFKRQLTDTGRNLDFVLKESRGPARFCFPSQIVLSN